VINTYGTGLDTSAIIPKLSRVQATLVACTLSAALVYLGHFYSALVTGMGVYLQLLACFSVPWIIIVTIGHFSRRAFYDPDALQVFNRGERGGIYWYWRGFNLRGMLVWTVSAGTGLFFANNTWFAGPGSALVDGADIGFVVAGVVAAIAYPLVLKIFPEPAEVFGDLSRGASTSIERRFDTEPTPEFT
jgi:purine-cytosine permease-like protein